MLGVGEFQGLRELQCLEEEMEEGAGDERRCWEWSRLQERGKGDWTGQGV